MSKIANKLITVFMTSNRHIFKVAKSLLDEAKIEYFVKGDGLTDSDSFEGPYEIQVINANSVKAKTLIADLQELDFDEKNK